MTIFLVWLTPLLVSASTFAALTLGVPGIIEKRELKPSQVNDGISMMWRLMPVYIYLEKEKEMPVYCILELMMVLWISNVAQVFTAIATFRLIQFPIRSLPNTLTQFIMVLISVRRISKFLRSGELDPDAVEWVSTSQTVASFEMETVTL